jgi:hypothetical protein
VEEKQRENNAETCSLSFFSLEFATLQHKEII